MTKLNRSPPRPQPKQCHVCRAGVTTKLGDFSPWNGHRPLKMVPAFLSGTVSATKSTRSIFCLTASAVPTDVAGSPGWARTGGAGSLCQADEIGLRGAGHG